MPPFRLVRKDGRSIEEGSESSTSNLRNGSLRASPSLSISTRTSVTSLACDDLAFNRSGVSTMQNPQSQDDAAFDDLIRRRRMEYVEHLSSRLKSSAQGNFVMQDKIHPATGGGTSSRPQRSLDNEAVDRTSSLRGRSQNIREQDLHGHMGLSSAGLVSSSTTGRSTMLDTYPFSSRQHEAYEFAAAATATNRAGMLYETVGLSRGRTGMAERNQLARLPEGSLAEQYDAIAAARSETEEIIRNSRIRMAQGSKASIPGSISDDPSLHLISSGRSHLSRNMLLETFPYSTVRQLAPYELSSVVERRAGTLEQFPVSRGISSTGRPQSSISAEAHEAKSVSAIRANLARGGAYGMAMPASIVRTTDNTHIAPMINEFSGHERTNELHPEDPGRKDSKVPFAQVWDDMVDRLLKYKREHGDCMVPWNYKKDAKLGSWVSKQRHYYSSGSLSQDRIDTLTSIGFVWEVGKQVWDEMFKRLEAYREQHGDCLVPTHYKKDPKLGRWVYMQRTRKSKIEKEQIARLESIGFRWSVHKAFWEKAWEKARDKGKGKGKAKKTDKL